MVFVGDMSNHASWFPASLQRLTFGTDICTCGVVGVVVVVTKKKNEGRFYLLVAPGSSVVIVLAVCRPFVRSFVQVLLLTVMLRVVCD